MKKKRFTKRIKELENIGKERTIQVGRLMTQCRYLVTLLQKTGMDTTSVQAELLSIGRMIEGTSLYHQSHPRQVEHIILVNEATPKTDESFTLGHAQAPGQVQPPTSFALSYLPAINAADAMDPLAVAEEKLTPRAARPSSASSHIPLSPSISAFPSLPPATPRASVLPPEYPPFTRLSQPLQTDEISKRVSRPNTPLSPTSTSASTFAPTPPSQLLKSTSAPKFVVAQAPPAVPRPRTPTLRSKLS